MKVILKEDVKGTGKKGQIVEVSDGFGKNFLIKANKAVLADSSAINEYTQKQEAKDYHQAEEKKKAQAECDMVNNKTISLSVKVGDNGKIFGSVTTKEVADKIKELGIEVDRKKIELLNPIKQVGIYTAKIKFYKDVIAKIKIEVMPYKN